MSWARIQARFKAEGGERFQGKPSWWPAKGALVPTLTPNERRDALEGRREAEYAIVDEPEHVSRAVTCGERVVGLRDFAEARREEMQAFVLGKPSRRVRVDPTL